MSETFQNPSSLPSDAPFELISNPKVSRKAIEIYCHLKGMKDPYKITQSELGKLVGLPRRYAVEYIGQLYKSGWLEKDGLPGQPITYIVVTPDDRVYNDLLSFLEVSKFFHKLKLDDLLKKYKHRRKLLNILEIYEFQYEKSGKPINNPTALIRSGYYGAVRPEPGFKSGFWKSRVVDKQIQKEQDKRITETAKADKEFREQLDIFMDLYNSWPLVKQIKLRDEAIKAINGNGGMPRFGAELKIKFKMFELHEAEEKWNTRSEK